MFIETFSNLSLTGANGSPRILREVFVNTFVNALIRFMGGLGQLFYLEKGISLGYTNPGHGRLTQRESATFTR
jgi:hypothetical protein